MYIVPVFIGDGKGFPKLASEIISPLLIKKHSTASQPKCECAGIGLKFHLWHSTYTSSTPLFRVSFELKGLSLKLAIVLTVQRLVFHNKACWQTDHLVLHIMTFDLWLNKGYDFECCQMLVVSLGLATKTSWFGLEKDDTLGKQFTTFT